MKFQARYKATKMLRGDIPNTASIPLRYFAFQLRDSTMVHLQDSGLAGQLIVYRL